MDIGINKVLGNLIRNLRKEQVGKRITQKEFSDLSGLHINTIHLIESGINEPKISTFIFIARAFNREPEELMKLLMEEYYSQGAEKYKALPQES